VHRPHSTPLGADFAISRLFAVTHIFGCFHFQSPVGPRRINNACRAMRAPADADTENAAGVQK